MKDKFDMSQNIRPNAAVVSMFQGDMHQRFFQFPEELP
jgi:hypothetical protein